MSPDCVRGAGELAVGTLPKPARLPAAEAEGKQGPLVSEAVCGLLQEPTGLHPPDSRTVCRYPFFLLGATVSLSQRPSSSLRTWGTRV